MTELLAHTDAYRQEFDATVVAVNPEENAVALAQTAFIRAAAASLTTPAGWTISP